MMAMIGVLPKKGRTCANQHVYSRLSHYLGGFSKRLEPGNKIIVAHVQLVL